MSPSWLWISCEISRTWAEKFWLENGFLIIKLCGFNKLLDVKKIVKESRVISYEKIPETEIK